MADGTPEVGVEDLSLREEMARRLIEVGNSAYDQIKNEDRIQAGAAFRLYYGILADEVIRQMEWARRECGEYFRIPSGVTPEPGKLIPLEEVPLTLAPEDWKP